ncbi:MAG: IS110 family transposase [Myxococcota bacterium]
MLENSAVSVGLDVGDRWTYFCAVDHGGIVLQEGRVPSTTQGLNGIIKTFRRAQWVMEAGTHSFWMDRHLCGSGIENIVVNPRRLKAVSDSLRKTDRSDAAMLALLGMFNPKLLWQVRHRSYDSQLGLGLLKVREQLVRTRTKLINTIRGLVKSFGARLRSCDTARFHKLRLDVPDGLREVVEPLFDVIETLQTKIGELDNQILQLAQSNPASERLMSVPGVGPITSLAFVLVIDDPTRFAKTRQVGAYLGLTRRIDQSGDSNRELAITKAGDKMLRKLLVQCSHLVLRDKAPDNALKQWGLRLLDRGGRGARGKAVVAVARKLATLLLSLWKKNQTFQAFPAAA